MNQQRGVASKGVRGSGKRLVWRITANAPLGEYVDPDAPVAKHAPNSEPAADGQPTEPGWLLSSFELTHGLDVSEQPDTIPGELFDELFNRGTKP